MTRAVALAGVLLALAAQAAPRPVVSIAAAANLKAALEPVVTAYRASHPDVDVQVTYGASGTFFAQLQSGAPFDVFLAADAEFPTKLVEAGLVEGKAETYAIGTLVLWVAADVKVDLSRGLVVLTDPAVRKVATGNPALAPYGAAAVQALKATHLYDAVQPKLVLGQSVGQAAQFVESGNAQAGFLPLSMVLAPPLAGAGRYVRVHPGTYARLEQAGVVLKAAKAPAAAKDFLRALLGPEGRALLEKNGYGLP